MKLLEIMKSPRHLCLSLAEHGFLNWMPDKCYLKLIYRCRMGKRLDIKHPKTYNEKLQWLKLYDRKTEYSAMVDKLLARKRIAKLAGETYLVPLLGVWDRPEDIDFSALPEQFVLKCNHDSGSVIICRDKASFDEAQARKALRKALDRNAFWYGREWPYKSLRPQILAEQYLKDDTDQELRDYKFFTFGGIPKILYIAQGRGRGDTYADFFDMDFNHIDMRIDHDNAPEQPHKPQHFERMKELAAKLSAGTPELRVDLYEVNGKVYVGELTFFHCSGFAGFDPIEWDGILGAWIEQP